MSTEKGQIEKNALLEEQNKCIELGLDKKILEEKEFDIYQLAEIRKGLEDGINVSTYLDESIPWFQMEEIRLELEENIDMSSYRKEGFDWTQIIEIRLGLADNLDVSVYAKKEYLAAQMREIRLGLLAGVAVLIYANPSYDWFQMEEIRLGLEHQVDISIYAKKEIPFRKMRQIRLALESDIYIYPYLEYDADIMQQAIKAAKAGVDISTYINAGYEADALEEIRIALEHGINLDKYLDVSFTGDTIKELRIGLEKRLPIDIYADVRYNFKQMQEIRLGLEHQVDVSFYAKPLYLWEQMREIRLGLEAGLDVAQYSSMMYSPTDMKRMRKQMQRKQENLPEFEELQNEAERLSHIAVSVSWDKMEAYVELESGYEYQVEDITHLLELEDIKVGLQKEAIEQMIAENICGKTVLVARGKKPTPGADGYYEYKVKTEMPRTPKKLPDGSVDYQNIEYFEQVKAGQVFAVYHAAEAGEDGYDVLGNLKPAPKGKEKPVLTGQGFLLLEDKKTYVAAMEGKIEIHDTKVSISRLCVLEKATLATGNLKFNGSILVRGDVGNGVCLEATEDIVVEGTVEAATLKADGNIVLKGGMMGNVKGYLEAKGDISGRFLESVGIKAGKSVQANYVMNCNISAEEKVTISGKKGSIIGGWTACVHTVSAQQLGNTAEVATIVKIGMNEIIQQQWYEIGKNISKVQGELKVFYDGRDKFRRKFPVEVLQKMDIYIKIGQAIEIKERELARENEKQKALEERFKDNGDNKVVVKGGIYPGTIIGIDAAVWNCKSPVQNVTVKKKENKVALYSNV